MKRLSRRMMLRGLGTVLALPALEAMLPSTARAQATMPKRFLTFFVPNGVNLQQWIPTGSTLATSGLLGGSGMAPFHARTTFLKNVHNLMVDPLDEGAHHRGTSGALTCATPTGGARFKLCSDLQRPAAINPTQQDWDAAFEACSPSGASIDQVLARALPLSTRFRSLEYGPANNSIFGGGSNYSPAYCENISWLNGTTPIARRTNPRLAFEALTAGGSATETMRAREQRLRRGQSVIDSVRSDALTLQTRLGTVDRRRLDEYLTGIRELEERLNAPVTGRMCTPGMAPAGSFDVMTDIAGYTRAFIDIMVIALKCDLSRVVSFMLGGGGNAGSYQYLPILQGEDWSLPSGGVYPVASVRHHDISHWSALTEGGVALPSPGDRMRATEHKYRAYSLINGFHVSLFAELLGKLAASQEPDGSALIDHCVSMYISEISDGDSHARTELPVLLVGGAGVGLTGNRVIDVAGAPLANIYLALARQFGVTLPRFGAFGTAPHEGIFS